MTFLLIPPKFSGGEAMEGCWPLGLPYPCMSPIIPNKHLFKLWDFKSAPNWLSVNRSKPLLKERDFNQNPASLHDLITAHWLKKMTVIIKNVFHPFWVLLGSSQLLRSLIWDNVVNVFNANILNWGKKNLQKKFFFFLNDLSFRLNFSGVCNISCRW